MTAALASVLTENDCVGQILLCHYLLYGPSCVSPYRKLKIFLLKSPGLSTDLYMLYTYNFRIAAFATLFF